MTTLVHELDLPTIAVDTVDPVDRRRVLTDARRDSWIVRNDIGFTILTHEDCVAMLRDLRWHSAASKVAELAGVTDQDFLARRRTSILSAEGEHHARLRRVVVSAFTRPAADRYRPYMREVIGRLVAPVATAGRT